MSEVSMLIGGANRAASNGATFERLNPVTRSGGYAGASRHGRRCRRSSRRRRGRISGVVGDEAHRAPRALAQGGRPAWMHAPASSSRRVSPRPVRWPNWYGFNVHLAANMLREAAAMTTQIDGELIPSDMPGSLAHGRAPAGGVVLGIAPWNAPVILGDACDRDAARVRQHRGAQGIGGVSGRRTADRQVLAGSGPWRGRGERRHQRADDAGGGRRGD